MEKCSLNKDRVNKLLYIQIWLSFLVFVISFLFLMAGENDPEISGLLAGLFLTAASLSFSLVQEDFLVILFSSLGIFTVGTVVEGGGAIIIISSFFILYFVTELFKDKNINKKALLVCFVYNLVWVSMFFYEMTQMFSFFGLVAFASSLFLPILISIYINKSEGEIFSTYIFT